MRPIERGEVPVDEDGNPKEFSKYIDARGDLIERIGEYCCYCEMHLDASLAVEHVKPKKHNPGLELRWDNFLLGCTNCNSIKGSEDIDLDDYYWPDRDNTALALEYGEGGTVRANPALSPEEQERAERTIKLTGQDRRPGKNAAATDRRWVNRYTAWNMAVDSLEDLRQADCPALRRQIARTVQTNGFWSVWMTVFRDDPNMLHRFIEAFPNTSRDCFDEDDGCKKVRRPGGAI